MIVADRMRHGALTCHGTETLAQVARVMWESDCGAVVVVDFGGRGVGMITDRDIAMAAYTQGRPLRDIRVESAASKSLAAVTPDDSLEAAASLMERHQIRRLPVIDASGRPIGMLSLNDLVREAAAGVNGTPALQPRAVLHTLAAVGKLRGAPPNGEGTRP